MKRLKSLSSDIFVITPINEKEAYLGDDSLIDGNAFVKKRKIQGDIVVNSIICGYIITGIKQSAIRKCNLLKSITLPNTITHLDYAAYTWCDNLEKIVFPASIISIDKCIDFFHNTKHIYFEPNSRIETIGENFLRDCSELEEFTFPKSLKSLGPFAFDNCPKFTKCYFCGETDLSTVSQIFLDSPIVLILVTKYYKGRTFGNRAFVTIPYSFCMNNKFYCQTIYKTKSTFQISLFLMLFTFI